jgi:excisionase family DNA binding protein
LVKHEHQTSEYITDREVARRLGLAVATLRGWRSAGEGPPFYRFGRAVRYRLDEVEAWVTGQKINGTPLD